MVSMSSTILGGKISRAEPIEYVSRAAPSGLICLSHVLRYADLRHLPHLLLSTHFSGCWRQGVAARGTLIRARRLNVLGARISLAALTHEGRSRDTSAGGCVRRHASRGHVSGEVPRGHARRSAFVAQGTDGSDCMPGYGRGCANERGYVSRRPSAGAGVPCSCAACIRGPDSQAPCFAPPAEPLPIGGARAPRT